MNHPVRSPARGSLLSLAAVLLIGNCLAQAEELPGSPPTVEVCQQTLPGNLPDAAQVLGELQDYLQLSEQALSMRAQAIQLYQVLQAKLASGEALNGQDLLHLNQGAAALLAQRSELLQRALAHECWALMPPPASSEAADIQRIGVLISLSAALTLYDNYLSAISLYQNDPLLRQHLNQSDPGFALQGGELNRVTLMFASSENRRRVRRAIAWYQQYARETPLPLQGYSYLIQSVEQSPSYRILQEPRLLGELGQQFEIFSTITIDTLFGLKKESTHFSSLIFGNTVGLVETRRGKLDQRPEVATRVAQHLQAGDILLEKTPFRLTDTFIPGHWGHAAIWVGSEAELKALNLWDHPCYAPTRPPSGPVKALSKPCVLEWR